MKVMVVSVAVHWRTVDGSGVVDVPVGIPWGTPGMNSLIKGIIGREVKRLVKGGQRVTVHATVTIDRPDVGRQTRTFMKRTTVEV